MFSSLARLRVVLFTTFLFAFFASAREDKLFTSSVTYCRPPESLLVQQFDVTYFAKNHSVSFNITAATVIPNLDVTANLFLNAYGMKPVNLTLDFCTILDGALCPLPIHDFSGHASLTIPDEFSDRIPGIAYKIPDLEAFAQLTLTERGTGDVKACVQATLANGWSTHQPAVEWTIGGITLATFLVALWQSRSPNTILPFRLLDMISFYQSIASSAFLSINYPSLYRSFTLNFGWSMSLFTTRSAAVQFAINDMRARTGGGLANSTTNSAVGLVNRKLSPFNDFAAASPVQQSMTEISSSYYSRIYNAAGNYTQPLAKSIPLRQLAADSNAVQTVTEDSSNVLQAGIPIYVNSLHIATANAFMTVFICALVLIGIALFIFGLAFAVLFVMERFNLGQDDTRLKLRYSCTPLIRAWSLRLALIMFFPIVLFALYQWTLDDSWLSVLLSVISFIAIMAGISYVFFLIFRQVRRSDTSALYSTTGFLQSHGPVYAQYRNARYYFFLVFIIGAFLKALFIAAAKSNGLAQVILIILVEISTFVALLTLRPHKTRGGDVFSSFLTVIRIICAGLLFAFVESFGVQPIPRVVIGAVIAVIFSVSIIIIVINLILNLGSRRLGRKKDDDKPSRPASRQESADIMLEKGLRSPHSDSESTVTRARNPTPDHNIPLDPEINRPYPATPTTAHSPIEYESTRARDSASTNFGSVLPRRWSITPLHTPTSSSVDHSTATPQVGIMARTSEGTEPPSPGLQAGKDLRTHSK
ncbi:integral to membrane protein [Moniliophthora roreri MCA 2997]|uniref:Integral to membrane protein n=1 Tax=Moniliophthora roreri (strain MCA 2997) TaxID=1381753 RepID=V2YMQ5_MONRO|nr:integral to membrane protein [Moniliophthora roreri MCA 2997]